MERKALIQNILIGIALFGISFLIYYITENVILWCISLVFWLIYMLYFCYNLFYNKTSKEIKNNEKTRIKRLEKLIKRNKFNNSIKTLLDSLQVLEFRREFFEHYDDGSIRKSFDLLDREISVNVEIAISFMEQYNYDAIYNMQSMDRLQIATDKCAKATKKLRELYELTVKVDDSTNNLDISYVDDLLVGLKEMINTENKE